jgi:hypothetical protein
MPESTSKFDPSIQSEDIAFSDEELLPCAKCGRKNSPERIACLYCAAALGVSPTTTRLKLRKLESWENGQNVIVVRQSGNVEELARLFSIEATGLESLLASGVVIPIARVASVAEANKIIGSIPNQSFGTLIVSDQELDATHPPKRLGGLELDIESLGLIDFNTRQVKRIALSDIAFVIKGTIIAGKTSTVEKRKRGKPKNVLEESSMITDESVIDIYTKENPTGYRIYNSGFDFSCLGGDKSMLASENMRILLTVLAERLFEAKVVTSYEEAKGIISEIWPVEIRKDHQGLVRSGIGKREFGMTEITNNAEQFTKFSRLQWYAR